MVFLRRVILHSRPTQMQQHISAELSSSMKNELYLNKVFWIDKCIDQYVQQDDNADSPLLMFLETHHFGIRALRFSIAILCASFCILEYVYLHRSCMRYLWRAVRNLTVWFSWRLDFNVSINSLA